MSQLSAALQCATGTQARTRFTPPALGFDFLNLRIRKWWGLSGAEGGSRFDLTQ